MFRFPYLVFSLCKTLVLHRCNNMQKPFFGSLINTIFIWYRNTDLGDSWIKYLSLQTLYNGTIKNHKNTDGYSRSTCFTQFRSYRDCCSLQIIRRAQLWTMELCYAYWPWRKEQDRLHQWNHNIEATIFRPEVRNLETMQWHGFITDSKLNSSRHSRQCHLCWNSSRSLEWLEGNIVTEKWILLYILKRKQIFVVVVAAEHTTLLIFNTIIYTIRKNIIARYSPRISDFLLHGIKIAIRLARRNKL